MRAAWLICEVCYACVPLEPTHLYAAHQRWHRTLTNLPGDALSRETFHPVGWAWGGEAVLFEEEKGMEFTDFGWALARLREGQGVTRRGWNGRGQRVDLQVPDSGSKMSLPYLFITTVQGDRVPWLASQTDMLATDWEVVA